MSTGPSLLHLQRRDAAQNMARFYRLSIAADLFGGVVLLREWGRIGTRGHRLSEVATDADAARRRFARIALTKRRRGYVDVAP